jgi:hypothetical protein
MRNIPDDNKYIAETRTVKLMLFIYWILYFDIFLLWHLLLYTSRYFMMCQLLS